MKKRFLNLSMIFVMVFNLCSASASASVEETLDSRMVELSAEQKVSIFGNENVAFLEENEISLDKIEMETEVKRKYVENGMSVSGAYKDIISSIKRDAETYNLSKEQIQNYIEASMKSVPIIGNSEKSVGVSSINNENSRAANRPSDNGIGWEVMSLSEYSGATTFLKLPKIENRTANTAGYMFYTIDTTDVFPELGEFYMDFGVGYDDGDGGVKWRVFQVIGGGSYPFNAAEDMYEPFKDINIDSDTLYFKVEHMEENPGFIKFEIIEGEYFSKIYISYNFYVGSFGLYDTNTSFNKQVTLCNTNYNYLTGTELQEAKFYDSYIYSTPNGITSEMLSEHCEDGEYISEEEGYELNRCGAFGTNDDNATQIIKNSGNNWYEENISIYFREIP